MIFGGSGDAGCGGDSLLMSEFQRKGIDFFDVSPQAIQNNTELRGASNRRNEPGADLLANIEVLVLAISPSHQLGDILAVG